jgi:crotonobetainyl-CoA:carnitine CoA-transferase CaiB-like acyl-CoA transferase
MPGFGLTGPYRDYPGNGGTIEAMSSSISLLGEVNGKIQASGIMFPDPIAGLNGAAAVLSALYWRHQTGKGCHVEVSQQESMVAMLGEFFEGDVHALGPLGNRDRKFIPNGIFQCLGEDDWVAISVRDEQDWGRLVDCLDDDTLRDPDLSTADVRRAREAEIEDAVNRWSALRTAEAAESQLVAVGLPAARVRSIADVIACPQLTASGYWQLVNQPEGIVPTLMPGIIARLDKSPGAIRMSPVRHGEHSREVLSRLLGIPDSVLDDLDARGIIGSGPPPA